MRPATGGLRRTRTTLTGAPASPAPDHLFQVRCPGRGGRPFNQAGAGSRADRNYLGSELIGASPVSLARGPAAQARDPGPIVAALAPVCRAGRPVISIHSVPYAQLALSPSALVPDCIGPTGKASSGLSLNQVGSRAGVGLQETRHWVPGQSVIDARVAGPTSR